MISDRELDGWNSLDAITRSRPLVDLADDRFYGDADWKKSVREKITRHFADRAPRPPLATAAAFARAFLLTEPIAPVARP